MTRVDLGVTQQEFKKLGYKLVSFQLSPGVSPYNSTAFPVL